MAIPAIRLRPNNPLYRWEDIYNYSDISTPVAPGFAPRSNSIVIPKGTLFFRYFSIYDARDQNVYNDNHAGQTHDYASWNAGTDVDKQAYLIQNILRQCSCETLFYTGPNAVGGQPKWTVSYSRDRRSLRYTYATPLSGFGVSTYNEDFNTCVVFVTSCDMTLANPQSTISDDVVNIGPIHTNVNKIQIYQNYFTRFNFNPLTTLINGCYTYKDRQIQHRRTPPFQQGYNADNKFPLCSSGEAGASCFPAAGHDICATPNYVRQFGIAGVKATAGPDSLYKTNNQNPANGDINRIEVTCDDTSPLIHKKNMFRSTIPGMAQHDKMSLINVCNSFIESDRKYDVIDRSKVNTTPSEYGIMPCGDKTNLMFDDVVQALNGFRHATTTPTCFVMKDIDFATLHQSTLTQHLSLVPLGLCMSTNTAHGTWIPFVNLNNILNIAINHGINNAPNDYIEDVDMVDQPITINLYNSIQNCLEYFRPCMVYNVAKKMFGLNITNIGHDKHFICNGIDIRDPQIPQQNINYAMSRIHSNLFPDTYSFFRACFMRRIMCWHISVLTRHFKYNKIEYRFTQDAKDYFNNRHYIPFYAAGGVGQHIRFGWNDLTGGNPLVNDMFLDLTADINPHPIAIMRWSMDNGICEPDPTFTALFPTNNIGLNVPDNVRLNTDTVIYNVPPVVGQPQLFQVGTDLSDLAWLKRLMELLKNAEIRDGITLAGWSVELKILAHYIYFVQAYKSTHPIQTLFEPVSYIMKVPDNNFDYLVNQSPLNNAFPDAQLMHGEIPQITVNPPTYTNNCNPNNQIIYHNGVPIVPIVPIVGGKFKTTNKIKQKTKTRKQKTKTRKCGGNKSAQYEEPMSKLQKQDKNNLVTKETVEMIKNIVKTNPIINDISKILKNMNFSIPDIPSNYKPFTQNKN